MELILVEGVSFSTKHDKSIFPGFFCKLFLSLLLPFFFLPVYSNNIHIGEVVKVSKGVHPDTLLLTFSLRWENSWRDDFNWDAAWVFLKYKTASGAWQPVYLSPKGHRFTDASGSALSFGSMEGETEGKTVGLFIYRTTLESGNTPEIRCHLLCPRSSLGGLSPEVFERNEAFILAQGIEMVYIPYGAYALGDGMCSERFAGAGDGSPAIVDGEEALSNSTATRIYAVTGGGVPATANTVAANYPKGYKGFYVMKYEVSQEQYVTFLNNLTYTQQQERVPGLASFSSGEYISGDASRPSSRNGIIVAVPSEGERAVIFANNLNNDRKYSQRDDGKTVACNYLSPEDMIAYLSWSGLRPMSELEYEKASRPMYPNPAVQGEYAWNTTSLPSSATAVQNGGQNTERPNIGNTNYGSNGIGGPVRCGAFANSGSTAETAGASFWGVMELSGNLRELCYNISASGFDGTVLGDGTYNTTKWNTTVSNFGVRGGGFTSISDALRISDRSEAGYFSGKAIGYQDSTVGFRGVRPVSEPVEPGSLIVKKGDGSAMSSGCLGFTSHIESATAASVSVPGMSFTYLWYVLEPGGSWKLLSGETGETLDYDRFVNNGTGNVTYQFKRKAICQVGEATSAVLSLTVPNTQIKVTPPLVYLDGANAASSVITATSTQTGGTFSWLYNNAAIVDGTNITSSASTSIYRPSRTHFGDKTLVEGDKSVICRYTIGECTMDSVVVVSVAPYNNRSCTGTIRDVEGHEYAITKIGDQCWMQDNMNIGTMSEISGESNYWRHDDPGIQKFCNGSTTWGGITSNIQNCDKYGGLYEWWEVVCAGYCAGLTTPDMEIKQGNYASMEQAAHAAVPAIVMAPDGYHIKGFCPDGWHLPTDEEWKQLEMYLGMSRAHADLAFDKGNMDSGWGRGDGNPAQATMMKSVEDNWNGLSTRTNPDDKYRFYVRPHGHRNHSGGGFYNLLVEPYFWASTPGATGSWYRGIHRDYASIHRRAFSRSLGFSVRCVRD